MDVKTHYKQLEDSKVFSDWKKDHPKSFLAHIFRMIDSVQDPIWQFGFYNENDTMTTFFLKDKEVSLEAEEEIFKANTIKELKLSSMSLGFEEALEKALDVQKKKYAQGEVLKTIAVLQVIEGKALYNITFITANFNTLNIRVDAHVGSILKEKLTALADLAQFQEPKQDKPDYVG